MDIKRITVAGQQFELDYDKITGRISVYKLHEPYWDRGFLYSSIKIFDVAGNYSEKVVKAMILGYMLCENDKNGLLVDIDLMKMELEH